MGNPSLFESAVNWIRTGYPEGIPPTDFPPLLALLIQSLDEEQVTDVVLRLARDHGIDEPLTEQQIHDAIAKVTAEQPTKGEINQVAGRLASAGWPLATPPSAS
ncbi:DUF3349 domain-containing protein [Gordonia sp. CPCC 206044]|uniref:DUF3349 domain-containing protein n=1 Tax=Gordonia sp. CPCC 206044 TaxID=3140793 RepID=UPI003AF3D24F